MTELRHLKNKCFLTQIEFYGKICNIKDSVLSWPMQKICLDSKVCVGRSRYVTKSEMVQKMYTLKLSRSKYTQLRQSKNAIVPWTEKSLTNSVYLVKEIKPVKLR